MRLGVSGRRTAVFLVLYLTAFAIGRVGFADGSADAVLWPAAGVAAVWLLVDPPWRWIDAAVLAAATAGATFVTGGNAAAAALAAVAATLQALIFALIVGSPGDRGGRHGGDPRGLAWLGRIVAGAVAGAAVGALVGAAVGALVGQLGGAGLTPATAAVRVLRDAVSVLVFGVATHLLTLVAPPAQRLPRWAARPALIATGLLVASVGAAYYVFAGDRVLPIAYALLPLTVLAAQFLSGMVSALHTMAVASVAGALTAHGHGVFAHAEADPAVLAQSFAGVLALVGCFLALHREQRDGQFRRLSAAEQAATEQVGMLSTAVSSMTEGLVILDRGGTVVLRNPAATRLLGSAQTITAGGGVGSDYGIFRPDGTVLDEAELPFRRAFTGEPVPATDLLVCNATVPEGRIVRFNVARLASPTHGVDHVVVVFHDVTADRRHRDEVMSFAATVANDLLNPLTTIEGWSEILENELAGHPGADRVSRIQRASARMRTFLNGMLAYTAARDGKLMPTTINLALLMTDIANSQLERAQTTGAYPPYFEFGRLDAVDADPVLTRQLLESLVDIAIESAPAGVVPQVGISSQPLPSGMLRVDVLDNGVAIPAGQRHTVFTDFHKEAGGAGGGLRLAICKRIVERHGGTIEALPNPYGAGNWMSFTLPMADSAYARALHQEQQQRRAVRMQ